VCVWQGGAAAIDSQGRVLAFSEAEWFSVAMPAAEARGQPLGRARLTVVERILAMSAPVIVAMLVLLTPLRWVRIRRRVANGAEFAIEEVIDDETTLSKEQTETITRRRLKERGGG
jgi:hypothetical protein